MTTSNDRRRIDELLVERGWARDLREAQALVLRGKVRVRDRPVSKPGVRVPLEGEIRVVGFKGGYVSRGGLKLEAALSGFAIGVEDRVALDVGASYGGFTDCLLQSGARFVYAVDVGIDQLARRLSRDLRVKDLGGRNLSDLGPGDFAEGPPTLVTVDLSYLSLGRALAEVQRLLGAEVDVVALFKPLFEVHRHFDVRDPALYAAAASAMKALAGAHPVSGVMLSPVRGTRGAIEFFLRVGPPRGSRVPESDVDAVVGQALEALAKPPGGGQ
ncbi:MAG TPA: TlyA family RNA methyltransferase [Methylomirabilota bacterium]|nr:TlyA family RNA methyltransferase [Methylomirabilota bacterium]